MIDESTSKEGLGIEMGLTLDTGLDIWEGKRERRHALYPFD